MGTRGAKGGLTVLHFSRDRNKPIQEAADIDKERAIVALTEGLRGRPFWTANRIYALADETHKLGQLLGSVQNPA